MKQYAPRPLAVSKDYWRFMVDCYPGLLKERFYLRLMQHITHGPRDAESNRLLITEGMVRVMSNNYHKGTSVEKLLNAFTKDVGICLQLSDWDYKEGRARSMDPRLKTRFIEATQEEKMRRHKRGVFKGLVWYDTGNPITKNNQLQAWDDYDKSLLEIAAQIPEGHQVRDFMHWLHSQPTRPLKDQIVMSSDFAWQCIMAMPGRQWYEGDVRLSDIDQDRKDYALDHYNMVIDFPITRYKSTGNTSRLYAQANGLAKELKEVRRLFLAGCWELDLKSAQLGIVAKIWDCPKVARFLQDGGDIWSKFYEYLGVGQEAKGKIKQALFSVIFGGKPAGIKERWCKNDIRSDQQSIEHCEKFLKHGFIKELRRAARAEMKKIKEAGGAFDAFNDWWDILEMGRENIDANVRSVLAAVVQSHELLIMREVMHVIQDMKRCYVMIFLHDGITVKLPGETITEQWKQAFKIAQAINGICEDKGYLTSVKTERLPIPGENFKPDPDEISRYLEEYFADIETGGNDTTGDERAFLGSTGDTD